MYPIPSTSSNEWQAGAYLRDCNAIAQLSINIKKQATHISWSILIFRENGTTYVHKCISDASSFIYGVSYIDYTIYVTTTGARSTCFYPATFCGYMYISVKPTTYTYQASPQHRRFTSGTLGGKRSTLLLSNLPLWRNCFEKHEEYTYICIISKPPDGS